MDSLNDKALKVSNEIERNALPDGTRLLKQRRTGEYLALGKDDVDILKLFDGTKTVQEIFHEMLVAGERPKIREFYDLVFDATEKGFLYDGDVESTESKQPGSDWPVRSNPFSAVVLPMLLILGGASAIGISHHDLAPTLTGWLLVIFYVCLTMSFSYVLAGCALRAFDRQIYGAKVRMDFCLPFFTINTRDAFMGGRACEAAVSLNIIAGPFAMILLGWYVDQAPLILAGWISALLLSAPFGNAPAHSLLHALFRKAHVVPNNADKFMQNRLLSQIFNFKQQLSEEKYFIAFSTYAILWLGGVFRFSSDLLQQQVRMMAQEPEVLVTVVALAIVVLTPVAYAIWLASRNVWKVAAPKLSSAESSVKAGARESWKPEEDRLVEFLETIVLLSELPRDAMKKIAGAMSYIPVKKDTLIIREHDSGDLFFAIHTGEVEILKDDDAGVPQSVARLGEGDVFGEIALLARSPRTSSVRAVTNCNLLALNKADFDSLIVGTLGADKVQQLIQVCSFLRRNQLFRDWPSRALIKIANEFVFEDCEAGASIIEEGKTNEFFYLVYEGEFAVANEGKQVATLGPGEFCGEISLLRGAPANADVSAAKTTRALKLDKESFLDLVSQDFVMALALDREADRRNDEVEGLK